MAEEMTDGYYLDAMNQLKEMNDKREKELRKSKPGTLFSNASLKRAPFT